MQEKRVFGNNNQPTLDISVKGPSICSEDLLWDNLLLDLLFWHR